MTTSRNLDLSSLFSTPEEKKLGDDDKSKGSLLSSTLVEKNVENDNEPEASLSSSTTKAKQPRTMTSWFVVVFYT
jgi:hypothetical protein